MMLMLQTLSLGLFDLREPQELTFNPICHGPLGPDRFMGGGVKIRLNFKSVHNNCLLQYLIAAEEFADCI